MLDRRIVVTSKHTWVYLNVSNKYATFDRKDRFHFPCHTLIVVFVSILPL